MKNAKACKIYVYPYIYMNEISFFIFGTQREQIEALVNDAKLFVEDRTTLQEIIKEKEAQVHYVFAPVRAHFTKNLRSGADSNLLLDCITCCFPPPLYIRVVTSNRSSLL